MKHKRHERRGGQAMLELAITAPFLAMILCLVIDFGYLLYVNVAVQNAARDAILMGFFKGQYTDDEIKANLLEHSGIPGLTSAEITCTSGTTTIGTRTLPTYQVSILHRHTFLVPTLFTTNLGFDLKASATTVAATDYDGKI